MPASFFIFAQRLGLTSRRKLKLDDKLCKSHMAASTYVAEISSWMKEEESVIQQNG